MSGHFIERWECGHVASQCRCPGPKEERTRPGKCPECAGQVTMPERDFGFIKLDEYPDAYRAMKQRAEAAESRLLAAEAMNAKQERVLDTLRAERDALVAEVARYKELLLTMEMPDA